MKGFRDVLILVIISTVAGICLSSVYTATKDKIAEAKQRELQEALKKVMPFLKEDYQEQKVNFNNEEIPIYTVQENGKLQGAAMKMVSHEGYGGDITFLMGVDKDAKITGFYMLDFKETPGLGTKATKPKFYGQFIGKSLETFNFKVKKDKGSVEAITAATITSRAVSSAMEKGLKAFKQFVKGGA